MKAVKRNSKRMLGVLLAATVAAFSLILGGCTSFIFGRDDSSGIEFTRRGLVLDIGDTFNLSSILECNSNYIVSSSDASVVSVSGSTITAKGAGRATITAETALYYDELGVTVRRPESDALALSYDGKLVQTVGETSVIKFYAEADGKVANGEIEWYVNGKSAATLLPSETFEFTPEAAGEYSVYAKGGACSSQTVTVRSYRRVGASLDVSGALDQSGAPYSPITLAVTAGVDANNPSNYIEWIVDGEKVAEGANYTYAPVAGRHEIKAIVNGEVCDSVSVACAGSVVPAAPTFEFDNLYPHAYIKYDAAGDVRVEITSPTGTVAEYSSDSAAYVELFGENCFDAGSLIELCASGSSRRAYRFRVKSLGDGDLLGESAYSPYYTFMQLPSNASPYLKMRYCDKDLYITSDYEYANALEFYVMNRRKTGKSSSVSFNCYIAYTMSVGYKELWDSAFETVATSGMYSDIDVRMSGNVMHTEFSVDTVNAPSRQTYRGTNAREYAAQLHAVLPHINFDASKYRDKDYSFPIDALENEQPVEYTDELFFAVQNNSKPVPEAGSPAETVYGLARDVLRKICTDDMTDVQKAHAIYDWIMWRVTYDSPATSIEKGSEAYSAYYLEGVFGNGRANIGGVVYSPYAVCDGLSKAYSLMCNIEGIPCVRVCGDAGESMDNAGGHAWNKVYLNGEWYVVDCTWGDSQGEIRLNGNTKTYELGLHDWLFLSDREADATHYEPFEEGLSSMVYAPETGRRGLDVYGNMTYFGVEIDCAIERGEDVLARVKTIATSFARAYKNTTAVIVPNGSDDTVYGIDYVGFDIAVRGEMNASDNDIAREIKSAIVKVRPRASVEVVIYDGMIIVLMKG